MLNITRDTLLRVYPIQQRPEGQRTNLMGVAPRMTLGAFCAANPTLAQEQPLISTLQEQGTVTLKLPKPVPMYETVGASLWPHRPDVRGARGVPTGTPWGGPTTAEEFAPGIVRFSTPSHGGFWLDDKAMEKMPGTCKSGALFAGAPWFEEDIDWSWVALTYPELFPRAHVEAARRTFEGWIMPKLEQRGIKPKLPLPIDLVQPSAFMQAR